MNQMDTKRTGQDARSILTLQTIRIQAIKRLNRRPLVGICSSAYARARFDIAFVRSGHSAWFRCVVPEAALSPNFKLFPINPNCQRANDVHIIKSL
ncbi:hypothetical protein AXG89_10800 [Burkholderia sp. PAMC 26561]|nr:hypothetical protein AXG89_10800 [Burkholderia sp. PAMC 26561]